MSNIRYELAAHVHDIWRRWMQYLVSQAMEIHITPNKTQVAIDPPTSQRWVRQVLDDFEMLTDKDQAIDYEIADGILGVIKVPATVDAWAAMLQSEGELAKLRDRVKDLEDEIKSHQTMLWRSKPERADKDLWGMLDE